MSTTSEKIVAAFCALSLLTALSVPVSAQPSRDDDPIIMEMKEKKKQAEETERRYRATLKNTGGDKTTPVRDDPWQNMRGSDNSKKKP
jgi:hypothetical protein